MRETIKNGVNTILFQYLVPGFVLQKVPRNAILYIFYGCISTLIDWGVFYVVSISLGFHYIPAATVSFLFSSSTNFVTNKYLNFENRSEKLLSQYAVHFTIGLSALLLTYLFLYLFIDILGLNRMPAKVITSLIMAVYGYFAHKNITFGNRHFSA